MVFVTLTATPIDTARLRLDPLTVDDVDEMLPVYADAAMFEFTGGEPRTLDGLRRRYAALAPGRSPDETESWLNWIVRLRDGSPAIGTVQATVVDATQHASVAWEIGVARQGQGFASEAATAMIEWLTSSGITAIEATINPRHMASQAVARRVGMAPTDRIVDDEQVWTLPS